MVKKKDQGATRRQLHARLAIASKTRLESILENRNISNISSLSKLKVSAEEWAGLEKDLTQILGYMEKLDEVEVNDVEPFYHPHGLTLRLRADRAAEVAGPQALEGSEGYENRLVHVPRIIE